MTLDLQQLGKMTKLALLGDIAVGGVGGILSNSDPKDKRSNLQKFVRGAGTGIATDLGATAGMLGGAALGEGASHLINNGHDGHLGATVGGGLGLGAGAILAYLLARHRGPKPNKK